MLVSFLHEGPSCAKHNRAKKRRSSIMGKATSVSCLPLKDTQQQVYKGIFCILVLLLSLDYYKSNFKRVKLNHMF